jgi:hypothetical protein
MNLLQQVFDDVSEIDEARNRSQERTRWASLSED